MAGELCNASSAEFNCLEEGDVRVEVIDAEDCIEVVAGLVARLTPILKVVAPLLVIS